MGCTRVERVVISFGILGLAVAAFGESAAPPARSRLAASDGAVLRQSCPSETRRIVRPAGVSCDLMPSLPDDQAPAGARPTSRI